MFSSPHDVVDNAIDKSNSSIQQSDISQNNENINKIIKVCDIKAPQKVQEIKDILSINETDLSNEQLINICQEDVTEDELSELITNAKKSQSGNSLTTNSAEIITRTKKHQDNKISTKYQIVITNQLKIPTLYLKKHQQGKNKQQINKPTALIKHVKTHLNNSCYQANKH